MKHCLCTGENERKKSDMCDPIKEMEWMTYVWQPAESNVRLCLQQQLNVDVKTIRHHTYTDRADCSLNS